MVLKVQSQHGQHPHPSTGALLGGQRLIPPGTIAFETVFAGDGARHLPEQALQAAPGVLRWRTAESG